ncbi:ABC transporter permease [Roseivirga misakiensis]|uniref:Cell division protein FtsX n=1 Tax=Roseivirga misakiensis TaxID=1563681 RepID=A0A1E5T068_9BACT|nr:ABC transporter permease [Roseivirga misakiensis]OEK04761.1 hypothetical protein BFP71_15050 [Roseivirga misakiensis]
MLKNYLKVAYRNIKNNKLYASLNILGLAIGLASFFTIALFISNELAYDQFHPKKDQVFRIIENINRDTGIEKSGGLNSALAPAAAEEIPEILAFTRLENFPKGVTIPGIADSTDRIESAGVDEGFFEWFDLKIIEGNPEKKFQTPNHILLAATKAQAYFGEARDALGQIIKIRNNEFIVQAVFEDLPNTSSIKADMIGNIKSINSYRGERGFNQWNASYSDQSYFLLSETADVASVEKKIDDIMNENSYKNPQRSMSLQPLADIHFSLDVKGPVKEKTDRQYIFTFTLVAIFILVCSVFNYVSLALSHSLERTKEVGVRRVIGARRNSLYQQFISESIIHVFISFILATVLVELLMPQLELLIGRQLGNGVLSQPLLLLKGLGFSLVVAVLCALYPAYLSTRLSVVKIFKNAKGGFSQKRFIGVISIFQIAVFVTLICVAFTANKQMHFMREENLGFDKESQLIINRFSRAMNLKKESLKNDLLNLPGVVSASYATSIPSRTLGMSSFGEYDFQWINFDIDEDYFETLGMKLLEGRNFLPTDTEDSKAIIINATAAMKLGFEDGAVGKTIERNPGETLRIIGVVDDFHIASKKQPIDAALFEKITGYSAVLVLKLSEASIVNSVDQIKSVYRDLSGGEEANYIFLEDQINSQYKQESVMITMINTFMLIAAIVAFIGLFGIAGYSTKRRAKEMGIRKVLGAGFVSIQKTLNRASFGRLFLAIGISVPLVIYWMDNWLSSFAYRIEMPFAIIVAAILIASVIMLLTVSFHSIKAYFINPVEILKDE